MFQDDRGGLTKSIFMYFTTDKNEENNDCSEKCAIVILITRLPALPGVPVNDKKLFFFC
jgi:hypothetical protein